MDNPHIQMAYEVLKVFFLEAKKNTVLKIYILVFYL